MTTALLAAPALLLLWAAAAHLRAPGPLRAALVAHGVLPAGLHRPVAIFLVVAEVVVGFAAVATATAWFAGSRPVAARAAALAVAGLTLAYAGYALLAWRATPSIRGAKRQVPCGCGLGNEPLTGWHATRAALMALAALTAAAWPGAPTPSGPADQAMVLAATLAMALLFGVLPSARAHAPRTAGVQI